MTRLKRVYEEPGPDEYRILVDRLWPRGLSKEQARIDEWLKDIAPTSALRQWFGHDPKKFEEFGLRYSEELSKNPALSALTTILAEHKNAVLLYAAKDTQFNQAVVLQRFLERQR